jgi:hypothetical protein
VENDVISISMGNTYDFNSLEDKIVICPEELDESGEAVIDADAAETCNSINVIDYVSCNEFKIACPTTGGHSFFFRIVTPGEVYSLGDKNDDGTVTPADSGLITCESIKVDYDANPEAEFFTMPIVNDHFKESVELSNHFKFKIELKPYKF